MIRLLLEVTSDTYGLRLQLNIAYKMRFCKSPVKKCRKCLFVMFFTLEDKKQTWKSTCVFMGKVMSLKGNSTSLFISEPLLTRRLSVSQDNDFSMSTSAINRPIYVLINLSSPHVMFKPSIIMNIAPWNVWGLFMKSIMQFWWESW